MKEAQWRHVEASPENFSVMFDYLCTKLMRRFEGKGLDIKEVPIPDEIAKYIPKIIETPMPIEEQTRIFKNIFIWLMVIQGMDYKNLKAITPSKHSLGTAIWEAAHESTKENV
jgi:hypothetical protein